MEKLVWTDEFSVGVILLDEQHKRLFRIINRLNNNPTAKPASEPIADVLSELTRYAQEHFNTEEGFMVSYGYPRTEDHKKQHREFRKKVADFCFAASEGLKEVPQELLEYLHDWIINHILDEDLAMIPYLPNQSLKPI